MKLLHPESEPEDETPPSENIQQISRRIPHTHLKQIYYLFVLSICLCLTEVVISPQSPQTSLFYWKLNELQAFKYLIQFHLKVK